VQATNVSGALRNPDDNFLATSSDISAAIYRPSGPNTTLNTATITPAGNDEAHENMQPYLVMNYFICIDGGCYPVR
jgi:microcystin-dependent protein